MRVQALRGRGTQLATTAVHAPLDRQVLLAPPVLPAAQLPLQRTPTRAPAHDCGHVMLSVAGGSPLQVMAASTAAAAGAT